ncbi:MAG: universal stress protein [Promethearchaeota archaeon]
MLVGIDDSEESMRAAKRAIEIQKDSGGKVVAFHSTEHRKSKTDESEHTKILDKVENLFKEANVSVETRIISDQKPEDYIKNICEAEEFNLIILGYSGTHGILRRRVLGSIPTQIMNNALCDVLLVK